MDDVVSTLIFKVDTSEAQEQMDQLEKKTESLLSAVEKARNTLAGFDSRFPWDNQRMETEPSPVTNHSKEGHSATSDQLQKNTLEEYRENTFPSGIFRQWESAIEKVLQSTDQCSTSNDRDKIRMYNPVDPSKRETLSNETSEPLTGKTPEKTDVHMESSLPVHGTNTEDQSGTVVTRLVDRLEKSALNLLNSLSLLNERTERKETPDPLPKRDNDKRYLPMTENREHADDVPRADDRPLRAMEQSEMTRSEDANDLLKNLALLLRSEEQGTSSPVSQISRERLSASRNESWNSVPQEQGVSSRIESAILEMDRRAGEIVQLLRNTDGYLKQLASSTPNETIIVKVE